MSAPAVSVLVAAYRAEATLVETVSSALGQTDERVEVLVVDDASPVPVRDVLAHVRDPRLRVLVHERNRGSAAARNTALAAARAPVIAQLDADDAWEPRYVERILPAFADPAIGLAYANATVLGHPHGLDALIDDASVHPIDTFPKLAEQCPVPSPTAAIRTAAVRAAGGYDTSYRAVYDYDLYLRLAAAGWRFAYVDERLARYRWPAGPGHLSHDIRRLERERTRMWARFVVRHPRTPGPRRQLRRALTVGRGRG